MSNVGITIDFGRVPSVMTKVLQNRVASRASRAMLIHLRSKVAVYPPVSRRPMDFQSDSERREFFARLAAGEIEVPYRRGLSPNSESLGKRWQIKGRGRSWTLSNNASYASLVQGRKQHPYHKGTGWKTVQSALDSERGEFARILSRETERELSV